MRRYVKFVILIFLVLFNLSFSQILSPEKFFGFRIGEDKKLIGWDEIVSYLNYVDKNSNRITVEELGKTPLGKPFVVVVASSEANMKKYTKIKIDPEKISKAI